MIVICSKCGYPNKVEEASFQEPFLEFVCHQCGSWTRIETGTTGIHGEGKVTSEREGGLFHRDMQPSKTAPVLENIPFEEGETDGYHKTPKAAPASRKLPISVAIPTLLIAIPVIIFFVANMYGRVKTADAVNTARTAIVENDVIVSVTGGDLSVEVVRIQFAKKSGRDELARIEMNLAGTAGSTRVAVYMKRSGGDWVVASIQYVETATGRERPLSRL